VRRLAGAFQAASLLAGFLLCSTVHAQTLTFTPIVRPTVEERLKQYAGDNSAREATLKKLFENAGCTSDHLTEQPVKRSKNPNVICTLPGTDPAAGQVIIGAHFDRVKVGDGVMDNWSGASLLPSLFEALRDTKPRHTYVFIGFTDEEEGLVGSSFYVKQLSKEQKQTIHAMINMDTLGLSFSRIWATKGDSNLARLFLSLANSLHSQAGVMNVDKIGSADSESFREAGIPSLTIHSVTTETWPILHTGRDKIDQIHLDDYYQTYSLIVAYLAFLDIKLG
jgi:acetylornithine deacetylase/succinyl-diaminopimelate desuccinylase-like protein